ncbi:MAG TPA: glycoside hydrolase family 15 protein [Methylomirabilota bacterium]|jgi:GH15 family glucan-1,4-alpha-glucosidase|nr:glycoside hydrolase family 15 protein [Methylomirabilota bacterium]
MPARIEDYALIGDCQTAALVARDGSIDWLCLPRFDSGACFAALLGTPDHGRWRIAPAAAVRRTRRRYRGDSLVLETEHEVDGGAIRVIDCMSPRTTVPDLVRIVEGVRGRVPVRSELAIRFDYGSVVPWVRRTERGIRAIAGPDTLLLRTGVPLRGENYTTVGDFTVAPGERVAFDLTWCSTLDIEPEDSDPIETVEHTERWWRDWAARCRYDGPWRAAVARSLVTLKALTYAPTGGIVAAPTTSLPERLGGVRNWDYRFCWIRDATFTLYALMLGGYVDEAQAWREWLLRAVAGMPSQIQIMYGLSGERRLTELELGWLPGYEGAAPVRIGNAAYRQRQLDIFGEVMDALHVARREGLPTDENTWRVQRDLLRYLETVWAEPDEGIWEMRGPRRHFTHSKVMAWVALDRAVKGVERFGLEGDAARWRALRDTIHAEVCEKGYDPDRRTFVQYYGGTDPDASLLMMPLVGFLPPSDPRVRGTVAAVERELMHDGFVLRYRTRPDVDGLPPGEGAFLACTFWLADNLVLLGREADARAIFERLLGLANDVGLLSEQYDPAARRLTGNFPQAFTHVSLINTACNLAGLPGPADHRPER